MAHYSNEEISEILKKIDIVDEISETVQLRKKGRNYFGCCPFHNEKTASMSVSSEKQIFKCFGCGESGNVLGYVMKKHNYEFIDAINYLIDKYNIDVSHYKNSNLLNDKYKDKKIINQINETAAIAFYESLKNTTDVQILEYLKKRELSSIDITKFAIGYGNCKEPLIKILQDKNFTIEQILKSELIKKQETDGRVWYYETFKDRIVFPIFDTNNKVVAFGGRTIGMVTPRNPKYINSTENELYHKSEILYGLNFALQNTFKNIIITEGYMDCLALQKAGITNTVASLGTALTEQQVSLIKKYTDEVIMCYDQDDAGQNATEKAIELLKKHQINIKILIFSSAKDPDEFINKFGVEKFKECISNAKTVVDYRIEKAIKNIDIKDEYEKSKILKKVIEIISYEQNEVEQDIYINKYSKKFNISQTALKNEIAKKNKVIVEPINKNEPILSIPKIKNNNNKLIEEYLISLLLLNDKKIFTRIIKNILPEYIKDSIIRELYIKIINIYRDNKVIDPIELTLIFNKNEEKEILTEIMLLDLSQYEKDKLLEDVEKGILLSNYENTKNELLEKLRNPTITKDEKEILGIQLQYILTKILESK